MKPRTLVILLAILVVLAGAGALLFYSRDAGSPSEAMGSVLFEKLPVNEIVSIAIQTPNDKVTLKKGADAWVVEERFNYPADFSKITDLVRTLRDLKTGRRFESSEEVLGRLALKPPDDAAAKPEEKGTRIQMADAKGKFVVDLMLGNTRNRDPQKGPPDGQYVMLGGRQDVYLIDKILTSYQTGPGQWLEKSPVQVDASDIRKIACLGADPTTVIYAFERPEKGKELEWVGPKPDREIKKPSLNRLSGALSSLKIDDVAPVSADAEALPGDAFTRLDYTLFDGRTYHVYVEKSCSATNPCHIRLAVDREEGEDAAEKGAGDAEKDKHPTKAEDVMQENMRLKPWLFTIPEWQHQAFFTQADQLLEAKAEPKGASSGSPK